uniref:Uncharacterized protein n=1 Tax=Romanomermis culicivorax TaxID=13658 RepID=A0A915JNZ6_ROMCU
MTANIPPAIVGVLENQYAKMGRKRVAIDVKWQIIGMKHAGSSNKKVAKMLGVTPTCVAKTLERYLEGLTIEGDYKNCGRKRCKSLADDKRITMLYKQ